jgi:hypothetical protein
MADSCPPGPERAQSRQGAMKATVSLVPWLPAHDDFDRRHDVRHRWRGASWKEALHGFWRRGYFTTTFPVILGCTEQ